MKIKQMESVVSRFCSLQNNLIEIEPQHRKWRRIHGFELPLHPQQLLACLLIIFALVVTYVFLIPDLPVLYSIYLYVLTAIVYLVLLISYTLAAFLDPAHAGVRASKERKPVPEFDRSKHSHVIENGRCHLCNITVLHQRTKHCSLCNKCVDSFDHHCRWLNQCVGGRNYKFFVVTVLSSILISVIILACSIAVLVRIYTTHTIVQGNVIPNRQNSSSLDNNGNNNTYSTTMDPMLNDTATEEFMGDNINETLAVNGTASNLDGSYRSMRSFILEEYRVPKTIMYTAVISVALIAIGMLVHLLVFHVYIGVKGLTTYEYLKTPSSYATKRMNSGGGDHNHANGRRDGNANNDQSQPQHTNGILKKQRANFKEKDENKRTSIEQESEAIWSAMTEIELNAPDGNTLPRGLNNGNHHNDEQTDIVQIKNLRNGAQNEEELHKRYFKGFGKAKPYRGLTGLLSKNKVDPAAQENGESVKTVH